jgi:hypothetical protein
MRLKYKRETLVALALLVASLGLVGFLVALTPFEGRRGLVRLVVAILGPEGAQVFVGAASLLMIAAGLRLVWLTSDGASAAEIGARGIRVRSIYYAGLIPWASVRAVDTRALPGWGNSTMLVIYRSDTPGLLLRLGGLGDKVAIQRKFLDVDDRGIEAWVRAAQNRECPLPARTTAHPVVSPQRVFGRRK